MLSSIPKTCFSAVAHTLIYKINDLQTLALRGYSERRDDILFARYPPTISKHYVLYRY
jgi:hypothetical protein